MENKEKASTSNLQKQLIEKIDIQESDEDDQSEAMGQMRFDRVNSAPEQTQVNFTDDNEVKVEIIDDDVSDTTNAHHLQNHAKKNNHESNRGKQFKSVSPNCGSQFRSILKSSKHKHRDSSLLLRVDANGNEIKPKIKGGEKPLHKITFHEQIEEVNVVENWKQYNTDVTSEPGCGCNLI